MELMFADRSERGKLRFTGPQRAWFLHQILTQSFEDMQPGEARDAAKLTAHGRMTGFMEFVATEDAFLCHFEAGLRATLPEEITRYIFATQVTVEDITDLSSLILVGGDGWQAVAAALPHATIHPTRSLGIDAGYLWLPTSGRDEVLAALRGSGATPASEQTLEGLRVDHAVPRWGHEMDTKTFPQEAGIDAWAVHYDKGCYVGQEAMAKIHFRGKVNRRLAKLAGARLTPGQEVISDGTKVGTITSAAQDQALALLRYTVEPGSDVTVGSASVKVVA